MGQQMSKRVGRQVEKASTQLRQKLKEEVKNEIKQKKDHAIKQGMSSNFTDPNALHGGFTRGQNPPQNDYHYWKDIQQEQFLKSQQKHQQLTPMANNAAADDGKVTEMPDDLIKFLNDIGPLKAEVDKDYTSPRLREKSLKEIQQMDDEVRDRQRGVGSSNNKTKPGSDGRIIREMPMVENIPEEASADDGNALSEYKTKRTTNFSTSNIHDDVTGDLYDTDIYNLVFDNRYNSTNGKSIDEVIEKYIDLIEKNKNNKKCVQSNSGSLSKKYSDKQQEEISKKKILLEKTIRYVDIPILMKDPDDNTSYIGTYDGHRKEELIKSNRLRQISKDIVQLNIAVEASAPAK